MTEAKSPRLTALLKRFIRNRSAGVWVAFITLLFCTTLLPLVLWGTSPVMSVSPTSWNFGSVPVGNSSDKIVTVNETGGNSTCTSTAVVIGGAGAEQFTVPSNTCLTTIPAFGSCAFTIRYAPSAVGSHDGTVTHTPGCPSFVAVTVSGTGVDYLAPSVPTVVFPADGQTNIATTLTFIWKKATDEAGDPITYTLFVCTTADFAGCDGIPVTALSASTSLLLAGGFAGSGLLLMGLVLPRRRWSRSALFLMVAGLAAAGIIAVACATPDDSESDPTAAQPTPAADEVSHEVSGLESNTTYYWKVRVADDNGNAAETGVYSFKTQ